jgi:hypothetical protein
MDFTYNYQLSRLDPDPILDPMVKVQDLTKKKSRLTRSESPALSVTRFSLDRQK